MGQVQLCCKNDREISRHLDSPDEAEKNKPYAGMDRKEKRIKRAVRSVNPM